MNSFITLFNLERLFGWLVYNLLALGLLASLLIVRVGLYGDEIAWSGPQLYPQATSEPRER